MSIIKPRSEPGEIGILKYLNHRMNLTEKDKQNYHNLVKGYQGEVMFDQLTEKLTRNCLILNDLLLELNGTKFQIDTLMVTQESAPLFEVKNFEGDFYFDEKCERFYMLNGKEIKNPLKQLERCESLLRQLFQSLGLKIQIEPYLVFINPHTTIYQAPLNKPIIYPNQLDRFFKNFNKKPSLLKNHHQNLANRLVSMHQIDKPHNIPPYSYEDLGKGIWCVLCHSFLPSPIGRKFVCDVCGHEESVDAAVLRCIKELMFLFPEMVITINIVNDWCGGIVDSRKTFRRILKQNLIVNGKKEHWFVD